MTQDVALTALASFGYAGPSAAFLLDVLNHSGWFLRRQYRQATESRPGGNDDRFMSRLMAADAKRHPYAGREGVYHVHTKRLYGAIGMPNSRHARPISETLRAERLMTLDYVLTHRDQHYIVGEEDRVQLFLGAYGVPLAELPHLTYTGRQAKGSATTRFFVEKFPIFVASGTSTVSFVFPQVAYTPYPHAFETFLARYARLFMRLPVCEIVYLYAHALSPTPAQRAFNRLVRPAHQELVAALERYFKTRRQLELSDGPRLTAAELQQFHRDAGKAQAVQADACYAKWLVTGRAALSELVAPLEKSSEGGLDHVGFRTVQMPHDYPRLAMRTEPVPRKTRGTRF